MSTYDHRVVIYDDNVPRSNAYAKKKRCDKREFRKMRLKSAVFTISPKKTIKIRFTAKYIVAAIVRLTSKTVSYRRRRRRTDTIKIFKFTPFWGKEITLQITPFW